MQKFQFPVGKQSMCLDHSIVMLKKKQKKKKKCYYFIRKCRTSVSVQFPHWKNDRSDRPHIGRLNTFWNDKPSGEFTSGYRGAAKYSLKFSTRRKVLKSQSKWPRSCGKTPKGFHGNMMGRLSPQDVSEQRRAIWPFNWIQYTQMEKVER
jgi:hypothetical protein